MDAKPADDELSLVLAELTSEMGADAVAALFDADDGHVQVIGASDCHAAVDQLSGAATLAVDAPHWVRDEDASYELLLAPVSGSGTRRLVIAAIYGFRDPGQRHAAELAYARVASFAGASLRLWMAGQAQIAAVRSLRAALDWSGMGIVLLDADGEIVFANKAACAILDAADGLRRHRNRIVACDLGDTVHLQLAIEHVIAAGDAVDGSNIPLLAIGRAGRPALMLSVLPPGPGADAPGNVAAILYMMDSARDVGELLHPVCRVYRLSPTEAVLARYLVAGETLATAAARMGVKAMTARGYLKQVFLKTKTHRQPELVQLMLSSIIHTHR